MTVMIYQNANGASGLSGIEFSAGKQGNIAVVHLRPHESSVDLKNWLSKQGHPLLAETTLGDHGVLIASMASTQEEMLNALKIRGDACVLPPEEKPFNPWAWRGAMSIVGQSLTLTSARMRNGGIDQATAIYAVCNLLANFTNIAFGAEKPEDTHRLHFLKQEFNRQISSHLPQGTTLPNPDESSLDRHKDGQSSSSISQSITTLIKHNSVKIGEIGLRYLGAFALVFPMTRWGQGFRLAKAESLQAGLKEAINPDGFNRAIGVVYLIGKTVGLFAKVPDPYDPKPLTSWDSIREKALFKTSTVIEAGADSIMLYDRLKNKKINLGGAQYPDYIGAAGSGIFIGAYGFRWFAPFGVKEMNLEELDAHIADGLAKVPPEKLPQLLADTTAYLTDHFKDKGLGFASIYQQLSDDLARYHHIHLPHAAPPLTPPTPDIVAAVPHKIASSVVQTPAMHEERVANTVGSPELST